ncbi:hypothetical protein AXG93_3242s1140 [Marchantia polymorpha subsp. ruderalis]|uniref:Vesicle transport protein n=1 Tax=Marchantia polymorpha subsp. ruderalis TaxID=1480154 RepID=A0A176WJH1_MARPO|nr:hypothetical protein AXG93_3242s1140 [Marchantia polymorpha subsp. ruderalis]
MDSVKMLVGQVAGSASASTEEPGFMEEVQGRLSMSRTHSTTLIIMPEKFAFTFTTANILLMGRRQSLGKKSQADPMCLKCAELLQLHSFFLTVIAIILEAIAIAWYALSYIPFARSMAKTMLHSCFPRIF